MFYTQNMFLFLQIRQDGCFGNRKGDKTTPDMAAFYLCVVAWWGFSSTYKYVKSTIHWNSA